jgi:SynChlorMet cassette radical SAM/SPASM protein ScmE
MNILSAPERVTLNITNRCNLACRYCAVAATKNAAGDLSLAQWVEVIDELARIKVFQILISGGEPFLREDFLEILRRIVSHPMRVAVNSNGTRLTEDVLAFLADSGRLNFIQVSLDGAEAAVHDVLRGQGAFAMLCKGIDRLVRHAIPFHFFVVVNRLNFRHLEEIVRFALDAGARQVAFSTLLPLGRALQDLDALMLSYAEQKQTEETLRRLRHKYPQAVGGTLVQTIEWMDGIANLTGEKTAPVQANRISSCGGSVSECAIRPEGWVIPCDRLWDYTVGNVRQSSFQDIWLHAEGFRKFRKRFAQRMDDFEECRGCLFTDICRGGCPATAYGLGRGINAWDPLSCYWVFAGRRHSTICA